MKALKTIFAVFLSILLGRSALETACAGIIPASRTNDWSLTGAYGGNGIPNRTDLAVNVLTTTNSRYKCAGDGVSDDTTPIVNALNDFAGSGKVIYLPTGQYRITSRIYLQPWQGWWTLRGDGPGKTIIIADFPGATDMFYCGNGAAPYSTNEIPIFSGFTKGSTNLVLCSTNSVGGPAPYWLAAGNLVAIDQINDGLIVTERGVQGIGLTNRATTFDIHSNGTRNRKQYVEIEAVSNATNITIWPPLATGWDASQIPWLNIVYVNGNSAAQQLVFQGAGFENLTFTNKANVHNFIGLFTSKNCWILNCEFENGGRGNAPVLTGDGLWTQISHCWFGSPSTNSDCVIYLNRSDSFRIEDTVFNGGGWMLDACAAGLIDYNFLTNEPDASTTFMQGAASFNHGAHSYMILAEGNVSSGYFQPDFYWGSSGQLVFFRNYILGSENGTTQNQKCLTLDRNSLSNSIVGNVFGNPSTKWNGMDANPTISYGYTDSYVYRLGYPMIGNNGFAGTANVDTANPDNYDPRVAATLFRTGNYDYFNNAIQWDGSGVQIIPNSLVYNITPAWWGTLRWPAVQPDNGTVTTMIPAQARFLGIPIKPKLAPPSGLRIAP